MFERFTQDARHLVVDARAQARHLGHRHVGTEHLLLAMAELGDATAALLRDHGLPASEVRAAIGRRPGEPPLISEADAAALEAIGIDIRAVRAKIEESFGPGALSSEVPPVRNGLFGRKVSGGPFTPRSKKVLELALREAIRLRQKEIGTRHILLGLLREGQGLAAKIMADAGVDLDALRRAAEASFRAAA